MKRTINQILITAYILISGIVANAQISLDTTIIRNDRIVCYTSNTPGYGNYLPPVITRYITILDNPSHSSFESPKHKETRIIQYLNDFSAGEAKNTDKELFLGYLAHILICNPYKTPFYMDVYLEEVIEISKNSPKSIRERSAILENLINDYLNLQEK